MRRMKFGKQLVKASMVSVQLCEPQLWLDYKKLKKFLKNIQPSNGQDISHSVDERKFFTLLKSEVSRYAWWSLRAHGRVCGIYE